jgi:hypothetical protein
MVRTVRVLVVARDSSPEIDAAREGPEAVPCRQVRPRSVEGDDVWLLGAGGSRANCAEGQRDTANQ